MIIKKVDKIDEANKCDELLTKLILSEKEYNENINDFFAVIDYFSHIYKRDNGSIFIAKDNDIVGYIYIKQKEIDPTEKNKEAIIDGLYVEEEYRHQGIAKKLINEAKKWASDNDIKYISINVLYDNDIAKQLYYNEGFKNNYINLKYKVGNEEKI